MSKVIRISESIFSRLQQLSTPLVDTPASVIERVLEYYEESHRLETKTESQHKTPGDRVNSSTSMRNDLAQPGLYLAPANKENLDATIIRSKPISLAEPYLTQEQFMVLKQSLKGKENFRCWAMTKNSRSEFNKMNAGDLVLFTSKGTGRFSYQGHVICKLESAKLGEALWSVVPNLPWELIYFLEDVTHIDVSKENLVNALGYDPGYVVPGINRVSPERVQNVIDMYGSIPRLITALSS